MLKRARQDFRKKILLSQMLGSNHSGQMTSDLELKRLGHLTTRSLRLPHNVKEILQMLAAATLTQS